jgi:hypothetical protein
MLAYYMAVFYIFTAFRDIPHFNDRCLTRRCLTTHNETTVIGLPVTFLVKQTVKIHIIASSSLKKVSD